MDVFDLKAKLEPELQGGDVFARKARLEEDVFARKARPEAGRALSIAAQLQFDSGPDFAPAVGGLITKAMGPLGRQAAQFGLRGVGVTKEVSDKAFRDMERAAEERYPKTGIVAQLGGAIPRYVGAGIYGGPIAGPLALSAAEAAAGRPNESMAGLVETGLGAMGMDRAAEVAKAVSENPYGRAVTDLGTGLGLNKLFSKLFSGAAKSTAPLAIKGGKAWGASLETPKSAAGTTPSRLSFVVPKPKESPIKGVADATKVIFDPTSTTPAVGETSRIIRARRGRRDRAIVVAETALKKSEAEIEKLSVVDQEAFGDRMERGEAQPTLALTKIAAALRKQLDKGRAEIQELGQGFLDHYVENYLPHKWLQGEGPTGSFPEGALLEKSLEGSRDFLQPRTYATAAEGRAAGEVAAFSNPVTLSMIRIREMQKFVMAQNIMKDLRARGMIKLVRDGAKEPPGYVALDDRIARVSGPVEGVIKPTDFSDPLLPPDLKLGDIAKGSPAEIQTLAAMPGSPLSGQYYAPASVAKILNGELSPGLRGNKLYDATRKLGNSLNMAQLGMSGFHLGATAINAVVSDIALGLQQLGNKQYVPAVRSIVRSPWAVIQNLVKGHKIRQEYRKPGTRGAAYSAIADDLAEVGGLDKVDPIYKTGAPQQFMEALRKRDVKQGVLNILPAAFEVAMIPIMDHFVPLQKAAIFADLARFELKKLPLDATLDQRRLAKQKAWDSVDNRLGQLNTDNLFWNKTFRDLSLIAVRSVGWDVGTIREIGGGAVDMARGKLTSRSAYTMALPLTVGLGGAILMYLSTGKGPETLKDYFYPQDGTFDADGNPNRKQLPSYVKDVYGYATHPYETMKHKKGPIFALVDMLENEDFYGDKIRNGQAPIVEQVMQSAEYFARQFIPMTVRNMQEADRRNDTSSGIPNFFGITPAPRSIVRSPAQALSQEIGPQRGERTFDNALAQQDRADILKNLRGGTDASEAIQQALQNGNLTPRMFNQLLKRAGTMPLIERFKMLPFQDALKVWKLADARERQLWAPILMDKMKRAEKDANIPIRP